MALLIPAFASDGTPLNRRRPSQAEFFIESGQAVPQYHPETGALLSITFRENLVRAKIYPVVSPPSIVKERVNDGPLVWTHRGLAASKELREWQN